MLLLADPVHGLGQLLTELKRRAAGAPAWVERAHARQAALAVRQEGIREAQRARVQEDWDDVPITVPRMMSEVWQAVHEEDWVLVARNGRSWYEGIWDFPGSAGCWAITAAAAWAMVRAAWSARRWR